MQRATVAGIAIGGAMAIAIGAYFIFSANEQSPPATTTLPEDGDIGPSAKNQSLTVPINDTNSQKRQVVLSAMLTGDRWDALLAKAEERFESEHSDIDIKIVPTIMLYEESRDKIAEAMTNQSLPDLISLDQIWLGEFAERGQLADLSDRVAAWGRSSEWYQSNWDGGLYGGKVYAIWAWTDVRGMWYWKDMLEMADVEPDSLRTWDGYIESAKKLDASLQGEVIEPVHLVGAGHSPDMWYPYLWMLDGAILEKREGHPSGGSYWYPAYNSTEGVRALEFLKAQVDAGIAPQTDHRWGDEFANRSFAVMLEGSWLPGEFPPEMREDFEANVGFIPAFPVPIEGAETATLMGGWLLAIPEGSDNEDIAWEFLVAMLEPDVITTILKQDGYLPTQIPIGEGLYAGEMRESLVYYDEMVSMLSVGRIRPNIAEYPDIAGHIRDAINEVYRGEKVPKQALDDAAARSAATLGWS